MTTPSFLSDLGHIDEPRVAHEYADVLTQVASEHRPVVVRRNGVDLAAVIEIVGFLPSAVIDAVLAKVLAALPPPTAQ